MSRRFQFSLKWLFVAMLVVGAFFGGMALQKRLDKPIWLNRDPPEDALFQRGWYRESIRLRDGTEWQRVVHPAADDE